LIPPMLDAWMILEQDLMKKILDLGIGWKWYGSWWENSV